MFARLQRWLFGSGAARNSGSARRIGTALIHQIAHGGIRQLSDEELMELVDYLLTTPQLRKPLHGNSRFMNSVASQYHRKRKLSARQRQAIYNILEKAYPHNLAVELRHFA